MTTTEQTIGKLLALADQFEKQNDILREEVAALKKELSEIKELIAQIKGGSRAVMILGSLVGGIAGAVVAIGGAVVKYGFFFSK